MPISSLLILLLLRQEASKERISFTKTLSMAGKRRRDRRIPRIALQNPSMSVYAVLYGSGNDQALITSTGYAFSSFHYMLNPFTKLYKIYSPYSNDGFIRRLPLHAIARGRPRSMTAEQCLALFLTWGRTRGSEMVLCLLYGITLSVCSLFLRFGRRLLLRFLSRDHHARVTMPTSQERDEFKSVISQRYSMLEDVYCVADGLKLYLEKSGDSVIQNMFYNGWTHDHYVGNIFLFAPNGVIIACALNAPGAMHDSSVADWGGVYRKLESAFNACGGRCVVDSAFSKGDFPFLIKSSQDPLSNCEGDRAIFSTLGQATSLSQATSLRQASEWGMHSLKGTFPCSKDRTVYEENGERKVILMTVALLFNLRTRLVGINHILTTFMPYLSAEANCFLLQD